MADLLIDGSTDGLRVGIVARGRIVQRCRDCALHLRRVGVSQFVDFVGGDAGLDERCQVIQQFGRQTARDTHAGNALCVFVGDGHGAGLSHRAGKISTHPRQPSIQAPK